ncbi:unnamed protein product [Cylicocyclus nassatus]|uniref:Uncharacterized protein n=1 Tax=Cylicocyclus nassatus TaxID=53992 RepID=A0AA36HF05_CYLNA|nr:unnamed protein product [Cylicocyclus nassatus]
MADVEVTREARTNWTTHARAAISRALADARQYELDAARPTLIPPKKKKSDNEARRHHNRKNGSPGLA